MTEETVAATENTTEITKPKKSRREYYAKYRAAHREELRDYSRDYYWQVTKPKKENAKSEKERAAVSVRVAAHREACKRWYDNLTPAQRVAYIAKQKEQKAARKKTRVNA